MSVKLLSEHHLDFLSLKGSCTGSSESTFVKMPHCWKSHVMAQMVMTNNCYHFTEEPPQDEPPSPVKNVDDFVPDIGELDASFLEDTKDVKDLNRSLSQEPKSDRYQIYKMERFAQFISIDNWGLWAANSLFA